MLSVFSQVAEYQAVCVLTFCLSLSSELHVQCECLMVCVKTFRMCVFSLVCVFFIGGGAGWPDSCL